MQKKLDTEELFGLIKRRYLPKEDDITIYNGSTNYLDRQITPIFFAYSAHGVTLQTNSTSYNGEVLDFCGQTVTCLLGQNDPWVTANMMAFISSGHPSFLSTNIGQRIYYEIPQLFRDISKMGSDAYVNHRLNNGSDATDFAIDIAFNFAKGKKKKLVSFKGSYHGQGHLPYGASELQAHMRFFNDLDVHFLNAPSHTENIDEVTEISENDKKIIEDFRQIAGDVFAVIIEPIQFNNNGNTPSKPFMKALRDACDELKVPLIFDEIQTAWGWLGVMTASERYGVWPDIMAISKSITSGYGPLSAVIAKSKFQNVASFGARTNGSDVRSLVAAKAVIERLLGMKEIPLELKQTELGQELHEGLLKTFPVKSSLLMGHLRKLRDDVNAHSKFISIGAIKGDGLARMIEIKTKDGAFDSALTKKLQKKLLVEGGVFVRTPSNAKEVHTLFIKMPIVVTEKEMIEGFKRMTITMQNFVMD